MKDKLHPYLPKKLPKNIDEKKIYKERKSPYLPSKIKKHWYD